MILIKNPKTKLLLSKYLKKRAEQKIMNLTKVRILNLSKFLLILDNILIIDQKSKDKDSSVKKFKRDHLLDRQ